MNKHHNLQLRNILRSAIEFGTLEQCLEAHAVCYSIFEEGFDLTVTEERLWDKLGDKIVRLQTPANEETFHVVYR